MSRRIHILGGSGSGTTTLGAHLALALDDPHHDTDDFYWLPTDPPYQTKRPVPDRLTLMEQHFLPRERWVLSGSLMGWGDPLIPWFDMVVFLTLPKAERMDRLMQRERRSYGDSIQTGGAMEAAHIAFIAWAERYDDPTFAGRSRSRQDAWCAALPCPVLQLDSRAPVSELVASVMEAFA